MRRRSTLFPSLLVVGALALTGCGSKSLDNGDGTKDKVTTQKSNDLADLVPKAIKDKGTLTIGTDASYAPSEFFAGDGKTIQGFDVDLFTAVATKLGLTPNFQNAKFDSIITGVQGKKYDLGVSSFTINADRLKQVNMVSYFNAGTQWAAPADKASSIDVNKPCGLKVAVQKGTVQQEEDLPAKQKACQAAGKPMKIDVYEQQDRANAAVVSGKDDAVLADSPVVAYAVKQSSGKLAAAGEIYDAAPYGYVVPQDDKQLADAIVAALKQLNTDGDYKKILDSWGVAAGGITDFATNPTP